MIELSGRQLKVLRAGLEKGFSDPAALEMFLREELDRHYGHYVGERDPYPVACFRILTGAESEGWAEDLILKANRARPHNPNIAAVGQELGLTDIEGEGANWSKADDDAVEAEPPLWRTFNPYRGLPALRECDTDYLFGRDQDTSRFIQAIATKRSQILLALGASGVGKSSLIFAGVFGALNRQTQRGKGTWPSALNGSREWPRLMLAPGTEPVLNLAGAFVRDWMDPVTADYRTEIDKWRGLLVDGNKLDGLVLAADEAWLRKGKDKPSRYLVYVDQGEELYTRAGRTPALDEPDNETFQQKEARRFSELLAEAAQHPRLVVLMSARSDFLPQLQADRPIFECHRKLDVAPLNRYGLKEVICKPAEQLGVAFEGGLANALLASAVRQIGGLPLLSDTLETLWKEMQARSTRNALLRWNGAQGQAVDVAHKLAERADAFVDAHNPQKPLLRRLFCVHLAHVPRQGAPTRRRALLSELSSEERVLVDELSSPEQRILTTDQRGGRPFAEVAHEALFTAWITLRNWIGERREFYAWATQIEAERSDYETHGSSAFLTGHPLERARLFLESDEEDIPKQERAYIYASIKADADRRAEEEKREQRRRYAELKAERLAREKAEDAAKAAHALAAAAQKTTTRTRIGLVATLILFAMALALGSTILDQRRQTEAQRSASEVETAIASESLAITSKTLLEVGSAEKALQSANESLRLSKVLVEKNPNNIDQVRDLAISYIRIGDVVTSSADPQESLRAYNTALAIQEKALGPNHPDIAQTLIKISTRYIISGLYDKAVPLLRRALGIRENSIGVSHFYVAKILDALSDVYILLARYDEAEILLKRARDIKELALGSKDPEVARCLNALGKLYSIQGRLIEAEPLILLAIDLFEKTWGSEHSDMGAALDHLAELYSAQGESKQAEPLYRRSLIIREKALGSNHPDVANSLDNLAGLYRIQGRFRDAESLYQRSLGIREKVLGHGHPDFGKSLHNLAELYQGEGRLSEAETQYRRSLAIRVESLGNDHPDVSKSRRNLAGLYRIQKRYSEAEQLYTQALEARKRAFGQLHPDVTESLDDLAELYFLQRDWARAAGLWRQNINVIAQRLQRDTHDRGHILLEKENVRFSGFVRAVRRLTPEGHAPNMAEQGDAFRAAQWASALDAAQSVAQMAARGANSDPRLAGLVRERQDLTAEWNKREALGNAAISRPADQRDAKTEAGNLTRLAEIEVRINKIDQQLAVEFPDHDALASVQPLSVEEVQAQLGADEALVLFLDTPEAESAPEETYIWVVTKTNMRWVRSDLGAAALAREVQALRCGLDEEQWATPNNARRCGDLLGLTEVPDASRPLPFDLGKAYELYKGLFSQIEDMIYGKRLLVVPSGALTSLPLHVLVTKKPENALPETFAAYRDIIWFGRTNASVTLPAVSSLRTLRQLALNSQTAPEDYIGYGNPVLIGDPLSCRVAKTPSRCPTDSASQIEIRPITIEGATTRGSSLQSLESGDADTRGAASEVVLKRVQALCPLPDAAYEIKCVAEHFRENARLTRLESAATEADIKALSQSGKLARYRIVHFATHGLRTNEVEAMTNRKGEPALVLTPPKTSKDSDDDGLLLASEVAQLRLNADWVVLSASNTAAGDQREEKILSGLARAFFYAGSRSLVVSHWSVYSDAAVRLTTRAFVELDRDPKAGHAEALQRAMIALMDDRSQPDNAHPAVWAPFVVAGEGGR